MWFKTCRYLFANQIRNLDLIPKLFPRFFSSFAQGGIYVFTLMDSYTAIVSLMFLAFFEMLALCWLYGGARLARNVKDMTGQSPPRFFVLCWLFIAPILIGVSLFQWVSVKPSRFGMWNTDASIFISIYPICYCKLTGCVLIQFFDGTVLVCFAKSTRFNFKWRR